MKRGLPYHGAFMLLLVGLYFLAFPDALTDPTTLVSMGSIAIAAMLLIVGALRETVRVGSREFDWNVPVGVAFVLLGVSVGGSMVRSAFYEPGAIGWILGTCAIAGGGSLVWFGVQSPATAATSISTPSRRTPESSGSCCSPLCRFLPV